MIADAHARERLRTDLERTFFVEAGAGTGKTTIVVGRIVNLIAAGRARVESLAAITFTEAAAAELRDRVREGLERAVADAERSDAEQARCRRAVEEIDLAAIQTIHAFALGLLRSYPLEAGLPPGFGTLDEIEQDLAFEERFREWFWGRALEEPARDVLRRAFLLGLTQPHLHDLAAALEEQHDLLAPDTTWAAPALDEAIRAAHAVGRALADLAPWTAYALKGEDDRLAQVVLRAQPMGDRLLAATTETEALAALQAVSGLKWRVGNQKDWGRLPDGRNTCAATKAALEDATEDVKRVLDSHRTATFAAVLALLRDFTLAGVAARKAEGVATFQDLLAWARDLLRDHPEVRRRVQARYERIFVDEFQDTDPLQAEIAFYLAAEPDAPLPNDWRDVALVPGKLFVVGDPKQSIYRFRRADIAVYDALLRRLQDTLEHLVQNFRSVRPVIEWVNHHFEMHMLEVEGLQPAYVALEARWESFEDGAACGVYRVGGAVEEPAAAVAAAEAEALAALARAAVEEGWSVADCRADGTRALRPARYRDVCLLLPSRTHLRSLERALERASVPYRVESGALLLATQEVRDLLAGLRAIEDPSDQVALVGALRSSAFGCSDPDLLRWVEGGGRLSHEDPGQGPDGPVKDALGCLAAFHARRHLLSPPALIDAYIRDRLLVAAGFGEPRPREAWRRLRYVVGRARAFTATGRHTLRAFLDWMDGLARAQVRDAESAEVETDEDALRILTIHGAKGLEFPIVFLAGLGADRRGPTTGVDVFADRASGALACRAGDWRTADFETARVREKGMAAAENVRLLYVAGTRARDHLVLSLYRGAKSEESVAAHIARRLDSLPAPCAELTPGAVGATGTARGATRVSRAEAEPIAARDEWGDAAADAWGDADAEQAWIARRREQVARLAAPPAVVDVMAEGRPRLEDDASAEEDAQVLAGGDLARAVRGLLRRASGDTLSDVPDADPRAVACARVILASDAYQQAQASPSCYRDVPLLGMVDGVLLDQVADLVYETPGGHALVLYDLEAEAHAAGEAIATPVGPARGRAGLVALAFDAATGRPPQRVEIVDATSGQTRRLSDVPDLLAEARAAPAWVAERDAALGMSGARE